MDKYLWIGGFYHPSKRDYYLKNGHMIMSSYKSQKNIFDGIEESCNVIFDSINSMRVNAFPSFKRIIIKKEKWTHNSIGNDISVPYLNIKYLSVLFRTIALKKEAKKWAKRHKNDNVYVFCFGMTSPFMKACISVSKIVKQTTLVLINPDLPQFMEKSPSKIKRMLKRFDAKWINKNISKFHKEILYSKHMAQFLKLPNNSWIVMEGSICLDDYLDLKKIRSDDKIRVLYAGVVGKMYGVDKLVESLKYLNDDYELVVYGSGDYEAELKRIASVNHRIVYKGYCGDRNELLQAQRNADILISLINPEDDVSKYCFPSKIFEYMLSGNLVISSKILGIPDEYFDYIFPLDSIDPSNIAKTIANISLLSKEKKQEISEKEIDFVLKTKNNLVQGRRIFNFVKNGEAL